MERNFSNRDFEEFVQENADQYRMFPSDKVWNGVHNALHTRRKWYGVGLAFLLLLTGGAVTWVMTSYPVAKKQDVATLNKQKATIPAEEQPVSAAKQAQDVKDLLPFNNETTTITKISEATTNTIILRANTDANEDPTAATALQATVSAVLIHPEIKQTRSSTIEPRAGNTRMKQSITDEVTPAPWGVDNRSTEKTLIQQDAATNKVLKTTQQDAYPLSIENVINHYKTPVKKISWQLFVTPTVSYRKLAVNKDIDNASFANYPFAVALSDVNSAVTHKPDMGLQVGVMGRYPITKSLKLRAGMQFNINRYDIKAYVNSGEIATINLSGGTNGNNSLSTWTNYRNQGGYKSDWLKNFYFSVAMPIGAEMKLFGNKKTNLAIAGTIQPTYVISDRAYLISTDYKNYAEFPRLTRHVNVSTGFETFVNFTKGKTKWQVGPQVRYQLLSSYHHKYPVKENLFDFGIKVGVTLNND
jgi:hypothetical protein